MAIETAIGARIRALREAAGIKSQDLAATIGIDPSAMSNIENGKRAVKTAELANIAAALQVSALALLDDDSLPARMPVAPRATGAVAGGTAYPRLIALSELHHVLDDAGIRSDGHIEVPQSLIEHDGWKAAADALADWVTTYLDVVATGDGRFPALVEAIERRLGVDVLIEPHPGDALAGAAISDTAFPLLFVNADQPTPRALFTLAHELGHLLAGHGEPIALDEDLSGSNEIERLANAFAARFLMPEKHVRAIIETRGRGAESLATMIFEMGVSFESLVYRLHNLQIVDAAGRNGLREVGWHGLLRAIERPDVAERLGPDVRRSLIGRLGSQPERRAPRWLLERALAGYRKGVLSIRPLAGLLNRDPDALLAEIEVNGASTEILRPEVNSSPGTHRPSDDELFGDIPV